MKRKNKVKSTVNDLDSNRVSGSILPIRIVVCRDDTWARNR